jgi:DNA-binding CsgD family transcriptional regulator
VFGNFLYPVLDDKGDVCRIVFSTLEITDRERADEAMRQGYGELEPWPGGVLSDVVADYGYQKGGQETLAPGPEEKALALRRASLRRKERELQQMADELEDLQAALRVLLHQKEKERKMVQEQMMSNINEAIIPHLNKLRQEVRSKKVDRYLDAINLSIAEIRPAFSGLLAAKYKVLSPNEVKVADFVMTGKTNKEIAKLLNVSIKTVEYYRSSIRAKLDLKNKKINLRSFLLSLS